MEKFIFEIHSRIKDLEFIDLENAEGEQYSYKNSLTKESVQEMFENYLNFLQEEIKKKLFSEKTLVYLKNVEKIEYPKIFLYLRGHDLEDIIYRQFDDLMKEKNKVSTNLTNRIIEFFEKDPCEMFIPFDLKNKLESLTKVYIQLDECNFEERLFHSDLDWFIKFIGIQDSEKEDSIFTKA